MLGLIKKDLLIVKSNLKSLIIIFIAFIFMSLKGDFEISFFIPFMCIMVFVSTFSYDDFNNWNPYAITFPCGRKNIVKSKYIASISLVTVSAIIGLILSFIVKRTINVESIIPSLIGSLFSISIIISIMYPLNFKYGSEKGRIILFASIILLSLIATSIYHFVNLDDLQGVFDFIENVGIVIIPILSVIFIVISYYVSKAIYLKKEF